MAGTWTVGASEDEVEILPGGGIRRRFHVGQYAPTRRRAVEEAVRRLVSDWPAVFADLATATFEPLPAGGKPPLPRHATLHRTYRYACPEIGARQLWLEQRSSRDSAWILWAIVDEPGVLLDVPLTAGGPLVTRRGHVVRWWTGSVATADAVLAFRSLMPKLVADEPAWQSIADGPFTPSELGRDAMVRAMAAAAMPWGYRRQLLRELPIERYGVVVERRVEHGWPSTHVRSVFAVPHDRTTMLLAICTRAAVDVPGRSPIGWSYRDDRAGVRQWADAQHWREPQWSCWDPSVRHLAHNEVTWLCVDAPGRGLELPAARVLPPNGEHREYYEPHRVEVESGTSIELAHRAAVLAVADHQRRAYGDVDPEIEPERLEGIRVPWRRFRAAYDHAAATPVYGGGPYASKRRRWSDDWYPRPRKPGVVIRWSGAWNRPWRWGYEWWGCHVWTIEWLRDPSLPRRIDVVVDVQTD